MAKTKWKETEDAVLPFSEKVEEFQSKKISRQQNAVSAWVHDDNYLSVANYYYCHASMNGNYHQHLEAPDPKVLLSQVQQPVVDIAHLRTFYEWLFNFSPFAPAFISKDGEAAVQRRVVVLDPNHPSNMIGGALISTRFGTERYQIMNKVSGRCLIWNKLVDLGVHPSLAFTLACSMYIGEVDDANKITQIKNIYFDPDNCSGHIPLQTGHMSYVLRSGGNDGANNIDGRVVHHNFFHGIMPGADEMSFRDRKSQIGSSYLWAGNNKKAPKYDVNLTILDTLKQELKGMVKKAANPFTRALVTNSQRNAEKSFDFEPAMEIIAKLSPDIVKEL